MTEHHEPRLFADDDAIRRTGDGLLARTLPRAEWTHEAHLAACAWILIKRPDIVPERDLPGIISRYNESVGGINDATQGYHETITQCFILAARLHLASSAPGSLVDRVNALLQSEEGRRDWPLRFFSPERLFSTSARLGWIDPDSGPLPTA